VQKHHNYNNNNAKSNRLINESSPYLLQHAYNPVDWYPWGNESLQRAKDEDKPIFLSIGYSACHWCHVMAHESFEDEEIANIMNENFINIKVDREERSDIDDIYQRVCQLATGNGGWPLSVFLSPDQKPFYVGTYFPKYSRYGMPGFGTILNQLAEVYKTKKQEIHSATTEFMTALSHTARDVQRQGGDIDLGRSILDEAAVGLLQISDPMYGGFGHAPKFPNPSNLLFMLCYYDISGLSRFKDFVMFTADKMTAGGIHDHIGGGFARYSTDQKWLIPHFEKMLYDNALLTKMYADLYQISKNEGYLYVIERTLDYIIREMTSPEGGFYSAQDADSEGEEGKFYVWSKNEIVNALGDQTIGDIFCEYYGVTQGGNFEGKNILNIRTSLNDLAQKYGRQPDMIERIIKDASNRLFEIREKRVKPGRDDKILTSWNGLMISGFAKGYEVTSNKKYLDCATNAVNFIETRIAKGDGRLQRTFKDGISKLNAYLDDYAFYVNALLDVFEVNSKTEYLERAIIYTDFMLQHFWDHNEGNLFLTSDDHEQLIVRTKNLYDLAIPSGNSIAASNLLRLYHIVQNNDYLDRAEKIIKAGAKTALENPFGFGQLLLAVYLYVKKPVEITIILNTKQKLHSQMVNWLNRQFIPNRIIAIIENDLQLEELQKYLFFKGKNSDKGKKNKSEFAFVCRNNTCSLPIYSIEELERHIRHS
jgi:uncharacterized protein YyaL (SSP411 family)